MKTKELIEILEQLDPETVVVLSFDPEGNSFSECQDAQRFFWDKENSEIYSFGDIDEINDDLKDAIVLWP